MTVSDQQRQILLVLSRQLEEVLELVGYERPASVLLAQANWLAANTRDSVPTSPEQWLQKAIADVVNDDLDGYATGFINPVDGPIFDWNQSDRNQSDQSEKRV